MVLGLSYRLSNNLTGFGDIKMTARAKVFAGACGFTSVIRATRVNKKYVNVKIISACKMLQKMNEDLECLNWHQDIFKNICDSLVYQSADKHLMHTDCPIPSAIIKVIQIELDGMVPMDVNMKFEKYSKDEL